MTKAKLRRMLDTQANKQRDHYEQALREQAEAMKTKDQQYQAARKAMLEEIIFLRDRVYTKKNVEVFKKEDIFRLESFTLDQVVDQQSAKLMNDRLCRMHEFYSVR